MPKDTLPPLPSTAPDGSWRIGNADRDLADGRLAIFAIGVFFKLGLVGESEVLLAGPSNAGLADPGHAAALSLMQISSVLMKQNPTIDNMVAVKVMQRLVDEIGDALLAAHQKLLEDDRVFSEKSARPGSSPEGRKR